MKYRNLLSLSANIFLIAVILFSCLLTNTLAQSDKSIDSLYNLFVFIKSQSIVDSNIIFSPEKCGMNIINQIKLNYDNFSKEQKAVIKTLLSRPTLQTSIVSPSGFFRIHYDETGINRPSYVSGMTAAQNAAEVAEALDSVYRFEIDYLGYLSPPGDNIAGGDEKYDVYIVNQGGGLYGYTEIENKVGASSWTSFVVIDNDYLGYYSSGINGMLVTAAHEFHHGIQVGNYAPLNGTIPYRNSDVFFYEITSTSMEEFVFDYVNDYYAYMGTYFQLPNRAMPKQNGYNLAIWNLYLKEKFGYDIIKSQWEMIPYLEAILSINHSIIQEGSTFTEELNTFGIWTYFTNSRAVSGVYFEEASNYPLVSLISTISFTPPTVNLDKLTQSTANNYYKINLSSGNDFLITLITNGDAEAANQNPNQVFNFVYRLYNYNETGSTPIVNNYYFTFETSDSAYWGINHIYNDIASVENNSVIEDFSLFQNFPNPFNPSTRIKFSIPQASNVVIKVFDVLGNDIETLVNEEKPIGTYEITWYAEGLPSGIYFYKLQAGNFVETNKMILMK